MDKNDAVLVEAFELFAVAVCAIGSVWPMAFVFVWQRECVIATLRVCVLFCFKFLVSLWLIVAYVALVQYVICVCTIRLIMVRRVHVNMCVRLSMRM